MTIRSQPSFRASSQSNQPAIVWLQLLFGFLLLGGCAPAERDSGLANHLTRDNADSSVWLQLPALEPPSLDRGRLFVIATTSIIGDVVYQIGGQAIELTVLMESGQDPHSYEPSARDMADVAKANAIFVNGWDLEEGLIADLANVAGSAPLIPVSANVEPLLVAEEVSHEGAALHVDPHVWMNPANVLIWASNVEQMLSELDPRQASLFAENGERYRNQLQTLLDSYDRQLLAIPRPKRVLVTSHEALGYLANRYDFEIAGTVIPASSTLAEPSAAGLSSLISEMKERRICTILGETTSNPRLAETVASELAECESVSILTMYTGALGPPGGGADSYIGMMEHNLQAILKASGP